MILENVDDVLHDIKEFVRKAPGSSGRARCIRSIQGDIENMRKNFPDISISLSITEIGDLMNADIHLDISN